MDPLRDLYQDVLLDHNRRPRNRRPLPGATAVAEGNNPLCGDQVTVRLRLADDGQITEATFEGSGCAISTASASLMTEAVTGMSTEQARQLFATFQQALTTPGANAGSDPESLGKLAALTGVRAYPMRVKCATLPWHTLAAALAPAPASAGDQPRASELADAPPRAAVVVRGA